MKKNPHYLCMCLKASKLNNNEEDTGGDCCQKCYLMIYKDGAQFSIQRILCNQFNQYILSLPNYNKVSFFIFF